jgi:hypothetical protein
VATNVSPLLCMSPGLTNESIKLVTVKIDLGAVANVAPEQALEEGEFCEVLKVCELSISHFQLCTPCVIVLAVVWRVLRGVLGLQGAAQGAAA